MKKLAALVLIAMLSTNAMADRSGDIIGALIIGGFVGNAIAKDNQEKQVQPQPIIIAPQNVPVIIPPQHGRPVYEIINVYDYACQCIRKVAIVKN